MIETGIEGLVIRPLPRPTDARGWLVETFRAGDSDPAPAMGYVSLTRPGMVRGPHEHRMQTDRFVAAGPGDLEFFFYDARPGSKSHEAKFQAIYGGRAPVSILVPPGIIHAYRCVSTLPALITNLPDRPYGGPDGSGLIDEIRHEENPDSPFYAAFEASEFLLAE